MKVNADGGLYLDMARLRAEQATHRAGALILAGLIVLGVAVAGVLALAGAF